MSRCTSPAACAASSAAADLRDDARRPLRARAGPRAARGCAGRRRRRSASRCTRSRPPRRRSRSGSRSGGRSTRRPATRARTGAGTSRPPSSAGAMTFSATVRSSASCARDTRRPCRRGPPPSRSGGRRTPCQVAAHPSARYIDRWSRSIPPCRNGRADRCERQLRRAKERGTEESNLEQWFWRPLLPLDQSPSGPLEADRWRF